MYDEDRKVEAVNKSRQREMTGQGGANGVMAGSRATDECSTAPTPISMRQRIEMQANESRYSVRATVEYAERLAHLRALAEKHPETIEIFDLLTRLGFR